MHGSDLRVGSSNSDVFAYPDVSVVCGQPVFEDRTQDTLTNPGLIVEVLSPSTEAYDRGLNFAHYRRLGSLSCYLLLSQDGPVLDCYTRESEGWLYRQVDGLAGQIDLPSLGIVLKLGDLFAKVDFDPRPAR